MTNRRSQKARRQSHHLHGKALTARELEVLYHVALGRDNSAIAYRLDVSKETIGRHITAIYRKTGLANRAQLVILAVLARLVSRDDLTQTLPNSHLPDLCRLGGQL